MYDTGRIYLSHEDIKQAIHAEIFEKLEGFGQTRTKLPTLERCTCYAVCYLGGFCHNFGSLTSQ